MSWFVPPLSILRIIPYMPWFVPPLSILIPTIVSPPTIVKVERVTDGWTDGQILL